MSARLAIDHVVIRVNDLARAVADYAEMGFTVIPGGEHPGLGSHNALIAFEDDSYLELIAFPERSDPSRPTIPKEEQARKLAASGRAPPHCRHLAWESAPQGLVDCALVPANIVAVIEQARDAGLHLDGPIPGGRRRPDGQQVSWQLAVPDGFDVPFLCADVTPRALRVPGGDSRRHRNAAIGIKRLALAVDDLNASAHRYQALLGSDAKSGIAFSGAHAVNLTLGSTTLTLFDRNADRDLRSEEVSTRDVGPCALWLWTSDAAFRSRLDEESCHGAWIELVERKAEAS